jgi:hypothetical protein
MPASPRLTITHSSVVENLSSRCWLPASTSCSPVIASSSSAVTSTTEHTERTACRACCLGPVVKVKLRGPEAHACSTWTKNTPVNQTNVLSIICNNCNDFPGTRAHLGQRICWPQSDASHQPRCSPPPAKAHRKRIHSS